jgi:hypothetical protein
MRRNILRWLFASVALSWGFNLFGTPVTIVVTEDLHDGLNMEDADAQAQIERTRNDYVEYEGCNLEMGEEVNNEWGIQVWNQKHRWWQR